MLVIAKGELTQWNFLDALCSTSLYYVHHLEVSVHHV